MMYLLNRLKEPSTYAGLSAIAYVVAHVPSIILLAKSPSDLAIAAFGLLAVGLQEGRKEAGITQ